MLLLSSGQAQVCRPAQEPLPTYAALRPQALIDKLGAGRAGICGQAGLAGVGSGLARAALLPAGQGPGCPPLHAPCLLRCRHYSGLVSLLAGVTPARFKFVVPVSWGSGTGRDLRLRSSDRFCSDVLAFGICMVTCLCWPCRCDRQIEVACIVTFFSVTRVKLM